MKTRDFRVGWRLLTEEPGYSAAVVFGLTLGFAACFLLFGFAYSRFSYNTHIPGYKSVYMLKRIDYTGNNPKWEEFNPFPLRDQLVRSGMDVQATVVWKNVVKVRVDNNVRKYLIRTVDPSFATIFGIEPTHGDIGRALSSPGAIAITELVAQQLFGETDVVGKTVRLDNQMFEVAAVLPNPPATTTVPYSILAGSDSSFISAEDRATAFGDWSTGWGKIYLKLGPKASAASALKLLQDAYDRSPATSHVSPEKLGKLGGRKPFELGMISLADVYFDPDFRYAANGLDDDRRFGDKRSMYALVGVALLILLLAATNYVNLATVRTMRRRREIAVRKLMGATPSSIVGQFVAESVAVAVLATMLGMLLAWLLLPTFSGLISRQLPHTQFADIVNQKLQGVFTFASVSFGLLFGLAVGAITGAYPAWVALGVRTSEALAGRDSGEAPGAAGQWLRGALTVAQFSTAMALIAVTLAIAWQTQYAINLNPGFNPEKLLTMFPPYDADPKNVRSFRSALTRLPGVEGVTGEANVVGSGRVGDPIEVRRSNDSYVSVRDVGVTAEFFGVYAVRAIAGRVFSPDADHADANPGVVLNASAVRVLGYPSADAAIGQIINFRNDKGVIFDRRVVGVAPDILYQGLRDPTPPVTYELREDLSYLTVRSNNLDQLEIDVARLWRQYFPNDDIITRRSREFVDRAYANDVQLAKLLIGSAIVTILIAAFGIYVLAAYSVRRRSREIALRKLHGADRRDIGFIVGREFMLLIVVAAAIGLPIAAIMISHYLANFLQRAPVTGLALLVAFVAAFAVAFMSTLRHTMIAMAMSPSKIFRDQ